MCYFLAIGAAARPSRLAQLLSEELSLPIDAIAPRPHVVQVFPEQDAVWTVAHRGCSCDLLEPPGAPSPAPGLARLTRDCRAALALAARQLGSVRLYLSRHRSGPPAAAKAGMELSVAELMSAQTSVRVDTLIHLVTRRTPTSLS